jgi:hypothetical protein
MAVAAALPRGSSPFGTIAGASFAGYFMAAGIILSLF